MRDFCFGFVVATAIFALYSAVDLWSRTKLDCADPKPRAAIITLKDADLRIEIYCRKK